MEQIIYISKLHKNASNQVVELLIGLNYGGYDNIILPNDLTQGFPALKRLTIHHSNVITMDKGKVFFISNITHDFRKQKGTLK